MYCEKCGSPVSETANFCRKCGTPVIHPAVHPAKKSDKGLILIIVMAAVLVVVAGIALVTFGIHQKKERDQVNYSAETMIESDDSEETAEETDLPARERPESETEQEQEQEQEQNQEVEAETFAESPETEEISVAQEETASEEAVVEEPKEVNCLDHHNELVNSIGTGFVEGAVLPEFTLYDAYGNTLKSTDLLGEAVYFNFFTTWCPYCVYEMPDLQTINDENRDARVILVDLAEGPSLAESFADYYGLNMQIYYLTDWAINNYSISGVPLSIVVDKYGVIHGVSEGMAEYSWMNSAVRSAIGTQY